MTNAKAVPKRLSTAEAQQWMVMQYDIQYGIRSYLPNNDEPYDIVEFNRSEDTRFIDLRHQRMRDYMDLDIQKHFGLSYKEFMELTRPDVVYMIELAKERNKKDAQIAANLGFPGGN